MIKDSQELGGFLRAHLSASAALAFDTHYDAQNWVLSSWHGKTLQRLEFQPLKDNEVAVTLYEDQFKAFPRLLRWAHQAIPLFPYLASIKWRRLDTLGFPIEENQIAEIVRSAGVQQGAPGDGPRPAGSARA